MDDYVKDGELFVDCPPPFPAEMIDGVKVMHIKEGTKFKNILNNVEKQFQDPNCRRIIFKGVGEATAKCISCVEVFKRSFAESILYQWNEAIFSRRTDTWKPMRENLSNILVHVDVPTLFILISRDPFPAKYINKSCQSSDIQVTGFTSKSSSDSREKNAQRTQKPKINRPSEANKWKRPLKKHLNVDASHPTKAKLIAVKAENA
uniref:DNA/RNA-binding protein Alba-like domain-containing protein n=2 Tax=Parascaris univalens TaxID=6257 RepID=A0A915BN77_PARUN